VQFVSRKGFDDNCFPVLEYSKVCDIQKPSKHAINWSGNVTSTGPAPVPNPTEPVNIKTTITNMEAPIASTTMESKPVAAVGPTTTEVIHVHSSGNAVMGGAPVVSTVAGTMVAAATAIYVAGSNAAAATATTVEATPLYIVVTSIIPNWTVPSCLKTCGIASRHRDGTVSFTIAIFPYFNYLINET
jgi:hypothetical protein